MLISDILMNWPWILIGVAVGASAALVIVQVILDNHREYLRTHSKEAVYRPYNFPPERPYYVRAAILIILINIAVGSAVLLAPGTGLPLLGYRAVLFLACLGLTLAVVKYTLLKVKAAKGSVE